MNRYIAFFVVGTLVIMSVTFASFIVFTKFSPEKEMIRMMNEMAGLSSLQFSVGVNWRVGSSLERENSTLFATGSVFVDDLNETNYKTQFRAVKFGRSSEREDLSGKLIKVNGKTYLTYTPPVPTIFGVDFNDKAWIEFDGDELEAWGKIIPSMQIPFENTFGKGEWTQEGIARLRSLIRVSGIFRVKYDGVTESVDRVKTRVINGAFDPDTVRTFLLDIIRAKYDREPSDEDRISADALAKKLSKLVLRFWIGSDDHRLYRVLATGEFPDINETDTTAITASFQLKDFNKQNDFSAPSNSIRFSRLFEEAYGRLPDSAGLETESLDRQTFVNDRTFSLPILEFEFSQDSDNDGLDNLLESFYGTDPNNFDTDKDGSSDGDEVSDGRNPSGRGSLFGFGL